jgi:hypothetical protein
MAWTWRLSAKGESDYSVQLSFFSSHFFVSEGSVVNSKGWESLTLCDERGKKDGWRRIGAEEGLMMARRGRGCAQWQRGRGKEKE